MEIKDQISLCSQHYHKWKDLALSSKDSAEGRKFLEKAFFWLELQTAFITLFAAEQSKGNDAEFKRKLLAAKANLSKKLAEYAENTLNEIQ
jgi:hypothetical protein